MSESRAAFIASYAFLALATVVWGVAPVFIRSFGVSVGPFEAIAIRTIAVGLLSLVLLPFFGGFRVEREDWPRFLLVSLIGSFGYYVTSITGYSLMPAGMGSIIMAASPLIMALLSALAGYERMTPATLVGLAVSFAGTVFLFSGDNQTPAGFTRRDLILGGALIATAAVAWAVYAVSGRPIVQKYGAIKYMALASVLSVVPALAFVSTQTWHTVATLTGENWFALAYLSILGTVVSVSAWNYAAARLAPTTLGASLYLLPLISLAAGWAMLGEAVTLRTLLSAAVVLAGVGFSQLGKYRRT